MHKENRAQPGELKEVLYKKKAKQVLTKWQASNCEAFHMTNEPSD